MSQPYAWRMQSSTGRAPPRRSADVPVALAAFFAAIGSFAVAYIVLDVRGLMDTWQCGNSDCDTVGLGAVMAAIAFGVAGALVGGFFTAWRAETLGEVGLR